MKLPNIFLIKILFIFSIITTDHVLANAINNAFNKRDSYINKTNLGNPNDIKFIDPNANSSGLQGLNDSSLVNKGNEALRNNSMGHILYKAEDQKIDAIEKYKINPQNPYLKNSMRIEQNPMAKTGGKGLSATEVVSTVKVEKTCSEGVDFNMDVSLELILDCEEIDDLGPSISKNIDIPFMQTPRHWWLSQQHYEENSDREHSFTYFTILNSEDILGQIQAEIIKRYNNDNFLIKVSYQDIILHTVANPINLFERNIIHPNRSKREGFISFGYEIMEAIVRFHYNIQEKLKKFVENGEYWQIVTAGSEKLVEANQCEEVSRVCLKSGTKIYFDKYEVNRPCWQEKITYHCKSEPKNGCDHLYKQNCQLHNSECEYKVDGICFKWQRKFLCNTQKKERHYSLANSPIYCLGGDCHTPITEDNQDFGNVAYLAALNEAKNDCTKEPNGLCKNPITVFPGVVDTCKKIITGFINCCSSMKGWGKNINMCRCSGNEKGLALKREKGLCHSIGTYCSKRDPVFKTCLEKKTSFCCFSSKLARIFHEQGRIQLGIGWGTGSSPNCRPLTLEELTRLDFSKFDMEELFDALLSKGRGKSGKQFPHIMPGVPASQKEQMSVGSKNNRNGM